MKPKRKTNTPLADLFESRAPATLPPFFTGLRLLRGSVPSFAEYPFNIPAIKTLDELPLHPKITFFVGENGSGKSTLMEAIAVKLGINAEGGSANFRFSTRESHSTLTVHIALEPRPPQRRITDSYFLRAESFYNVATEIERLGVGGYGGKSLHEQSHGESFFALLQERFRGDGLYLLDEPEAALSPSRQLAMLTILHQHISDGSQFIIATHSPILMAYPDAIIYLFDTSGIRRVKYEETDHYRLTRNFLNRRESMLEILLANDA